MTTLTNNMYLYVRNLIEREEGQDLVEYALVVALIAFGASPDADSSQQASTMRSITSRRSHSATSVASGPEQFMLVGVCKPVRYQAFGQVETARSSGNLPNFALTPFAF